MPSAIGVPGLYPVNLGGGGTALYTTIVTNDAELATALTTNGGDTFIVAGSYSIDTDTLGALDTTPRTFTGAGISDQTNPFAGSNGVNILFEGAGGAHTTLDFSAGLTEATGVSFCNVNLVSDTAALSSFLTGIYSGENIYMNAQTLTFVGISDSTNLSNCRYVNPPAGGIGFFGSTHLVNCTVGDKTIGGAETGFFICEQLSNCSVYYEAGAVGSFVNGFQFCNQLTNCRVDMNDVTAIGGGSNYAFNGCTGLSGCIAIGPSIGAVLSLDGFDSCLRMSDCLAERFGLNYNDCERLSDCESLQGVFAATGAHFLNCSTMSACHIDGTGDALLTDGYVSCTELAACVGESVTGTAFLSCSAVSSCRAQFGASHGFETCIYVSGCVSISNGGDGFRDTTVLAACQATSNAGDGFTLCGLIAGVFSVGNTGFGYATNSEISSAGGFANTAGLTDGGNLAVDPVTAVGI